MQSQKASAISFIGALNVISANVNQIRELSIAANTMGQKELADKLADIGMAIEQADHNMRANAYTQGRQAIPAIRDMMEAVEILTTGRIPEEPVQTEQAQANTDEGQANGELPPIDGLPKVKIMAIRIPPEIAAHLFQNASQN